MEMIHCFACGHKIHSSASSCPSCGAVQKKTQIEESKVAQSKTGWSWKAAIFQGAYYAGKGKIGKGLIYSILGIFPLIAVVNFFRLGSKANEELKSNSFSWGAAIFVGLINYVGYLFLLSLGK